MLSRADTVLRVIGFAVWAFIGAPAILEMFQSRPSPREWAWLGCYLAFAACLGWGTGQRPLALRRLALAGQSALALAMCALGMPRFEGALLAVVAAQVPNTVPLSLAVVWIAAQAAPLLLDVSGTHGPGRSVRAAAEYLTFGGFAMVTAYLWQREAALRKETGRLNAELLATQRLLSESTRAAERSRISRDLHDALGHHLVALGQQLQAEKERTGQASAPLAHAQRIAGEMLEEVRGVVTVLRKQGGVGVATAIEALAASMPDPELHLELSQGLGTLDAGRADALLRCVQEAVTNAVKHGGARNVWVRIDEDGQGVRMHLKDDGRGAPRIEPGHGLSGMRERLTELGGQLETSSLPGHGFELRVLLPRVGPPA